MSVRTRAFPCLQISGDIPSIGHVIITRAHSSHGAYHWRSVDESKWTVAKVPALRIIGDKLWSQAQKRRAATLEHYGSHRNTDG